MQPGSTAVTGRKASCLGILLLLAGCATSGGPMRGGGLRLDTATAGCGAGNAAACVARYGKEVASVAAVANAVEGALETPKPLALDWLTRQSIEEALVKCADTARSDVLLWHAADFTNGRPTAAECKQLSTDPKYKGKTWAQQLGIEMHEAARKCAEAALRKLMPGRFSLEQRYRYDRTTKQKKPVSAEDEKALVESGNAGELKGTLKPDVVIHTGDLLVVQAVYDFKFNCANDGPQPRWTRYSEGHPYEDMGQDEMYEEAFGVEPATVSPRWGINR